MNTYELVLPNMSCNHCAKVVTETLTKLDPQVKLRIDLHVRKVWIETLAEEASVLEALDEEGYPAQLTA
ncbi:MAG: copper chaperone [Burkholderiaceae bacterium]|jgi:copper chaperone|nr:MAG: copper chaperone [Burkholderiaceae bacterium]